MEASDMSRWAYPVHCIIRLALNSGKLTFEDETELRHQLATTKPQRLSWPIHSGILFGCSLASIVSGICVQSNPTQTYSGKILKSIGVIGASSFLIRKLSDVFLVLHVRGIIKIIHNYSDLTRKLTRWISDNEITQKGYFISRFGAGDRTNPVKTCMKLRKTCFLEFRRIFLQFRNFACDLTPSAKTETLICKIALDEFGDSLNIPETDVKSLSNATDDFSLQALKSLIGLLDLQISEFLRVLCSHLMSSGFTFLPHRLYRLQTRISEYLSRVYLEYEFETNIGELLKSERKLEDHSFARPGYLRSLDLHLTAALIDLRRFELDVPENNSRECAEERMEKLGYHVKCACMLLDNIKRRSLVGDQSPSVDTDVSPTKSDFEIKEVISADNLVAVEDEIFEAFMSDENKSDQRNESFYQENDHYQHQKQQSKVVLEEIKTVLSLRSADWKDREKRARERQGLPVTADDEESQLQLTESSETDGILNEKTFDDLSPIFIPEDIASSAVALSMKWSHGNEEHFGSDLDEDGEL